MPRNLELTTSEKNALNAIHKHIRQHGIAPSMRRVARDLGIYPNGGRHLVNKLKAKGYITETKMTLTAKGREAL